MFENDIGTQIFLVFISILSNFISALSGGGAGLIQLPALLFFGLPFSKALATHKVASVALGFGASVPHFKKNRLQIVFDKSSGPVLLYTNPIHDYTDYVLEDLGLTEKNN